MAFPQIGGIDVINILGEDVEDPQHDYETITREEIDGVAFREKAKHGRKIVLFAQRDTENPVTMKASFLALIGTFVTIKFPCGTQTDQVFVHHGTGIQEIKKLDTPVGGVETGHYMMKARFVVEPAKVT